MPSQRSVLVAVALTASVGALSALFACQKSEGGPTSPSATAPAITAVPQESTEIPGVDVSALTPRERREWQAYVNETLSPCADVPVSISQCLREKRKCSRCLPAARFFAKEVRDGRTREQAVDAYKARFDNDRVKNIDVDDTPMKGPATAPITIVEWADFECPFCKRSAPVIESMVDKFPGKVRFFFKMYPLSFHAHAEPAARAALAAQKQGKFWEMHHKLFEAQSLEAADIEKLAKELGLKSEQFKTDMQAEAVTNHIARDKKQGEAVGLQGTPLIYINGREFDGRGDFVTELEEWIKNELELAGEEIPKGAPRPAPSGSAAASGSPAPSASSPKK